MEPWLGSFLTDGNIISACDVWGLVWLDGKSTNDSVSEMSEFSYLAEKDPE